MLYCRYNRPYRPYIRTIRYDQYVDRSYETDNPYVYARWLDFYRTIDVFVRFFATFSINFHF